ncbi:MAG TPA: hypothetical protein VMR86_13790 [Myxococcota bacterium]|nr:hypothetical protein [Myxococcota bacterium]
MIAESKQAVSFLAQRLLTHVLPEQRTAFGAADAAFLNLAFEMIGQDLERGVHARLEDIRERRAIFAGARRLRLPESLAERLAEAEARELSDLRLGPLDGVHAQHGAALVALHAWVETRDGDDAARIDREIWQHLERHAERHRYDVNF